MDRRRRRQPTSVGHIGMRPPKRCTPRIHDATQHSPPPSRGAFLRPGGVLVIASTPKEGWTERRQAHLFCCRVCETRPSALSEYRPCRKAFYGAPALAKLDRCRGFELLASYSDGCPKDRGHGQPCAPASPRTGERVISGRSRDWRGSRYAASARGGRIGCGRIRRSQQARNGGSPCSLIRPARATHRYGT